MRVVPLIRIVAAVFLSRASIGTAQTARERGAWDALMLSPFGALPPRVSSADAVNRRRSEILVRYGRWRYDRDDAPHDNIGLTLAWSLPFAESEITLTGAYLYVQCGACPKWKLAGVDLESTVWRGVVAGSGGRATSARLGLRSSVGGARIPGGGASRANAAAIVVPIGVGRGVGRHAYLDVVLVPGLGYGRIAGTDRSEEGARPVAGAAATWRFRSGFGIEAGIQKVFLTGGPAQLGVGLSWGMGAHGGASP